MPRSLIERRPRCRSHEGRRLHRVLFDAPEGVTPPVFVVAGLPTPEQLAAVRGSGWRFTDVWGQTWSFSWPMAAHHVEPVLGRLPAQPPYGPEQHAEVDRHAVQIAANEQALSDLTRLMAAVVPEPAIPSLMRRIGVVDVEPHLLVTERLHAALLDGHIERVADGGLPRLTAWHRDVLEELEGLATEALTAGRGGVREPGADDGLLDARP